MTEQKLKIKDILIARDFEKLKPVISLISEKMNERYLDTSQLYQDRYEIFKNEEAYKILEEHIFAGKISTKLWRLDDSVDSQNILKIDEIIKNLSFYNKHLIDLATNSNISSVTPYTCIDLEDRRYLIRFIVPASNSKKDNGIEISHEPQCKNIVSIIDLNNKYIEVRGDYRLSKKVIKYMNESMGINGINEVFILNNYKRSIKTFKESFDNAMFTNVKSIPSNDAPLTEKDVTTLINTLKAINSFFMNRNYDRLQRSLMNIDIDSNEIGFIPLLLAGLSKIGISSKIDNEKDITNQPMYKLLESYLSHQSGHLKIIDFKGETYSINVGLKTNNIVFQNEKTCESFISMIRDKIFKNNYSCTGGEKCMSISESRIDEGIRTMAKAGIKSFYIEYFASIMRVSVKEAFDALYKYSLKTNKINIRYEIRCLDCLEELLQEVKKYSDIPFGDSIICSDCLKIVSISESNIFMKFYISDEVEEAMKENICLIPEADFGVTPNLIEATSSIQSLIDKEIIKVEDDKIKPVNPVNIGAININFGNAHSIGDNNKILEPGLV